MEMLLSEFDNGALQEQFEIALQNVLDNIYDPNTSAKEARKVTIEMTFKPDGDREIPKVLTSVKAKLAPTSPLETKLVLDYDSRSRHVIASEWGGQMRGQMSLKDEMPDNVTKINVAN